MQTLFKAYDDVAAWYRAWEKDRVMRTNVRVDLGWEEIIANTTKELNKKIHEAKVDYNKSFNEIINEYKLKEVANEALKQSIRDYVKGRLLKLVRQLPNHEDVEEGVGEDLLVDERAEAKTVSAMENYGLESAFIEALVKSAVNEGAKKFHDNRAESSASRREAALKTAEAAKEAQKELEEKLMNVREHYKDKEREMAEIDKILHLGRIKGLEKRISDLMEERRRELDKADEAERERGAAERNRDAHEDHSTKEEKEKVEREMKKRFRK